MGLPVLAAAAAASVSVSATSETEHLIELKPGFLLEQELNNGFLFKHKERANDWVFTNGLVELRLLGLMGLTQKVGLIELLIPMAISILLTL